MTKPVLNQFVPSHVCLKCQGCCRFKEAHSPWRPKLGAQEQVGLADRITRPWDDQGFLKTIEDCGNQLCQFFKKDESTCRIYHQRPFECSLYPFVLSQTPRGLNVYVHLSCPYVQDHQASLALEAYIAYLKDFFNQPSTQDFLERNKALVHDYSAFELELLFLFTIEGLCL
jgi:Fe-S-cluster containining protein